MITFRHMPSLAVPPSSSFRRSSPRVFAAAALALLALSGVAHAQSTLSHTEDAQPIPQGMLRFRITNGWTRFDERFAGNGMLRSLGDELSTDSLGPRQLPRLTPVEQALQTLTNDPNTRLTLGRLDVKSDARIVTTPIALEYGVTRRLSVGVVVPIVQTRRTVVATVNQDSTKRANVGYLQGTNERSIAATTNLAVANAYTSAATQLAALIASCQTNPSGAGCAAVNANAADAAAARAAAQQFADAVRGGLGTDAATALVAPRAGSPLAAAIEQQRVALNRRLQQFLGSGAGAQSSPYFTAFDFSYIGLQGREGVPGLLGGPLGGGLDSLATADRLRLGDVEIGARYLLFDRFQYDSLPPSGRIQSRLSIGGSVRFATSATDSASNLADIPTGTGAGAEVRSALDVISGRFGGTVAARYSKQFARTQRAALVGDPNAPFPYPLFGDVSRKAGDVLALDLTPRYLLAEWFALDAHYGFERTGATTISVVNPADLVPICPTCALPAVSTGQPALVAQRVGFGARYSTVDSYLRGRARYPVEVSFTHLETITGSAGVPKAFTDLIQLRLYYPLLGR